MGSIVEYLTDEDVYDSDGDQTGEREVTEYHQVDCMPCEYGLQTVQWADGEVCYGKVLFWHVRTAWRPLRKADVSAIPVTHNGAEDGAYILYPDGTVHHWGDVWDTLDEWIELQKVLAEDQRRYRERQEAAKAEQDKTNPRH